MKKRKALYVAHVMHTCAPKKKRGPGARPETIEFTIAMPFVPAPGTMLRPSPSGDFLKVAGVFWDAEDPHEILVFTEDPEPELLHSFAYMKHEGWRAKASPQRP